MRINLAASQWVGIALVLLVCALFGFVVPAYAPSASSTNVQVTKVAADTRVRQGTVSVVPGEGWSRSTELATLLVLKRANSTLLFAAPVPANGKSMVDLARTSSQIFTSDTSVRYTVGTPTTFTTTSGLTGAKVLVASPESTALVASVTDGKQTVSVSLTADAGDWAVVGKDVEAMLRSIELGSAATKGGA